MDDPDVALFARLNERERQSLMPSKPASMSEVLAQSHDPRMQALAGSTDVADVPFLLSLLSSGDAAVLEASADALWKLAIGGPARMAIHKANGARPLVSLLGHREPRVVRAAAGLGTSGNLSPADLASRKVPSDAALGVLVDDKKTTLEQVSVKEEVFIALVLLAL